MMVKRKRRIKNFAERLDELDFHLFIEGIKRDKRRKGWVRQYVV